MARDWRRYAHDLEHMLTSECFVIHREVLRRVIFHIHSRCLLPSDVAVPLAHAIADSVAKDRWSGYDPATCAWTNDADAYAWDTACGEKWLFNVGGPSDNRVRFCHGCGRKVKT